MGRRGRVEGERGSPRILYKFYHENISLGSRSVLSAGGVSLRVTVTVQDSGNYFCTADNGFGPQRSEAKSLSVKGKPCILVSHSSLFCHYVKRTLRPDATSGEAAVTPRLPSPLRLLLLHAAFCG